GPSPVAGLGGPRVTMLVPGGDPATMGSAPARTSGDPTMTGTAPTRRPRLTDVPSAYADEREAGYGYVWRYWAVVVLFAAVTADRAARPALRLRHPPGPETTHLLSHD